MNRFAIIRHEKIKAGRHLVSAGLHNVRAIETPNADRDAAPIEVMVGTRKPHRDVMGAIKRLGVDCDRIRKGGNVAIEVFLGASPDWWASKGWKPGVVPTGETLRVVEDWKAAQLAYLEQRFGKHLIANMTFHPDEANPHCHGFVIPATYRKDGRERGEKAGQMAWRLSVEQVLKGPAHMKSIVSDYARQMARFGLQRGEDRPTGTVKHQPLKEWQREQAELTAAMGGEVVKQIEITEEAKAEAARIRREAEDYAHRIRGDAEREARERREAMELAAQEAEVKRRKDDATNAARTAELRQKAAELAGMVSEIEAEKTALRRLRERLEGMLTKVEKMLAPISAYAARYLAASPIAKSAMGSKGPDAVRVASTDTVAELESMRAFMNGRGSGRR